MATKLYPPIIEETLPAFYKKNNTYVITIPFEMNKTVGYSSISGFSLKLRTILGGTSILKNDHKLSTIYDQVENTVTFSISQNDIITETNLDIYEGQFYKAQIAYYSGSTIGYYSTVGIIKCVAKPTVEIEGYNSGSINLFTNTYIGKYTQNSLIGDCSEKAYSYEFNIYDKDYNLFASSGEQIHDASQDEAENYSIDKFILRKIISSYEVYYIQYVVTTINKLKVSSPLYHISASETIDMTNQVTIIPKVMPDDGYILISFKDNKNSNYTGMYLLSKSADNGITWEEVQRFEVTTEEKRINKHIIKDTIIEQGKTYIYALQEFNKYEVYTNRILSESVYADYEDMYLQDKDRILKIRFNPKMNSFKNDIPEQKVDTIGSKYPFIFRNGNVYYKEFPIGGLLSFQLDSALDFLTQEEQEESGILEEISHRKYTGGLNEWQQVRVDEHPPINDDYLNPEYRKARFSTNLISLNIHTERYFKLKVLEWLNNGKPKFFKSATEGLYIVRLLNVSLSPEEKLGRMLHNFTSTAYEIAELNLQNLSDLELIPTLQIKPFVQEYSGSFSLHGYTLSSSSYQTYGRPIMSLLKASTVKTVDFIDFCPGDEIILEYADGDKNTFKIGSSHELHINQENRIITEIRVRANLQYINYSSFRRVIKYTYDGVVNTDFDNYSQISTMTLPCLGISYHNKEIVYDPIEQTNLSNNQEAAIFTPNDISSADELKKYLGYSFYADTAKKKPKILIKHIDQIIITKRQIVPIYRNPDNSAQYLLDVFGHGFLNDRSILQETITKTIAAHEQENEYEEEHLEVLFSDGNNNEGHHNYKYKDLPFSELRKKDGVDVFTFGTIWNNFLNDRFSILQVYVYNNGYWIPSNNYYIPFEGLGPFTLVENDWKYRINDQEFIAIPNSFNEGQIINNNELIINTSTYTKTINVDRFNDTLIPRISTGRGVCIDIVPQYLIYDYVKEDTNSTIKQAKQTFLEDKTLDNLYTYLKSLENL